MARKSIRKVEEQVSRALASIRQTSGDDGYGGYNIYQKGQAQAYLRENNLPNTRITAGASNFASDKFRTRVRQIREAGENAIARIQKEGRNYRASRKAQGLSAG